MLEPYIHRTGAIVNGCGARASGLSGEALQASPMTEQRACQVVTETVLSIRDHEERKAFARHLVSYSIASLAALENSEAAAEFAYRAADATVGVA